MIQYIQSLLVLFFSRVSLKLLLEELDYCNWVVYLIAASLLVKPAEIISHQMNVIAVCASNQDCSFVVGALGEGTSLPSAALAASVTEHQQLTALLTCPLLSLHKGKRTPCLGQGHLPLPDQHSRVPRLLLLPQHLQHRMPLFGAAPIDLPASHAYECPPHVYNNNSNAEPAEELPREVPADLSLKHRVELHRVQVAAEPGQCLPVTKAGVLGDQPISQQPVLEGEQGLHHL